MTSEVSILTEGSSPERSEASNLGIPAAEDGTETNCANIIGMCLAVVILGTGVAYILATVDLGVVDVSGGEDNKGGGPAADTDFPDNLDIELPMTPVVVTDSVGKRTRARATETPPTSEKTYAEPIREPSAETPPTRIIGPQNIKTPPARKTTGAPPAKTPPKGKTTKAPATKTPSTSTTTTTPAIPLGTDKDLICTVGSDAAVKRMYPDDGVCNYLYFTHIIVRGTLSPPFHKKGWLMFQKQMKARSKTGGGIAFDVHSLTVEALKNPTARAELTKLANENVKHYGLLNVMAQPDELAQLLEKAREQLNELKALQGNDAKRKTVLAVGLFDYSKSNAWDTYKSLFKKAVDEYKADTVIAISSTGYLESEDNCVAVPPLAIKSPNPAYPSLERHGELMKESFKYNKQAPMVGISFELAVLLYILEQGTKNYDEVPYRKCKSTGIGDMEILCGPADRQKSLPFGRVGHYIEGNNEQVYIGEEVESLKKKVEYIKTLGVRKPISWLAFNVHLTTLRENTCVSRFSMLQSIRDALNSL